MVSAVHCHMLKASFDQSFRLGPEVHFLAASIKDGKDFSWVCTHKVGRSAFSLHITVEAKS